MRPVDHARGDSAPGEATCDARPCRQRRPFLAAISVIVVAGGAWIAVGLIRSWNVPPVPPLPSMAGVPPPIVQLYEQTHAAVKSRPENAELSGKLGQLFFAHYRPMAAVIWFRRAQLLEPNEARWSYGLGLAQDATGNLIEAISAFREAVRLDPSSSAAWLRLSECLFQAGKPDEALSAFRETGKLFPNLGQVAYGIGRILANRGDWKGAAAEFQRACDLAPGTATPRMGLSDAYRSLGRFEDARREAHLARSFMTDTDDRWKFGEDALLAEMRAMNRSEPHLSAVARELTKQGRLREAIDLYHEVLRANPKSAATHVALANLYARSGAPEDALRHIRLASEIDPDAPNLHASVGAMLAGQGRYREAEQAFEKELKRDPGHVVALNNLGQMLARRGEYDKALERFRTGMRYDPTSRPSRQNAAAALLQLRRPGEAAALLRELAEKKDSSQPGILLNLAIAYEQMGRRADARNAALRSASAAREFGMNAFAETQVQPVLERLK